MKPTASSSNVARGAIVDQPALVEALREERLAGVGLDVVDPSRCPQAIRCSTLERRRCATLARVHRRARPLAASSLRLRRPSRRRPPGAFPSELANPAVVHNLLFTEKLSRFAAPDEGGSAMTKTSERLRVLHGSAAPIAEMRALRAGPVTMLLDGVTCATCGSVAPSRPACVRRGARRRLGHRARGRVRPRGGGSDEGELPCRVRRPPRTARRRLQLARRRSSGEASGPRRDRPRRARGGRAPVQPDRHLRPPPVA